LDVGSWKNIIAKTKNILTYFIILDASITYVIYSNNTNLRNYDKHIMLRPPLFAS